MIVYRDKKDLARHVNVLRADGRTIGLVPTMGALHPGHLSLVERSTGENDATVVTVFVNPTQFNDAADLENYPRTLDRDLEALRSLNVDVVFVPSVKEMYPEEDHRVFDLGGLDETMEGKHRKGHFNGVAQIVTKLFDAVGPDRAYFGKKDFQQLVIIRYLTARTHPEIDIIGCPTVREPDGLAWSSRNMRLTKEERKAAPFIHRTLENAKKKAGSLSPAELKEWVVAQFRDKPLLEPEYFEIVDAKHLKPVEAWNEKVNKVACIAVHVGEVRLIDTVIFD